jgi:ATP/maltotriose-dependent transcriptional regulator MalT/DNA-binding SARP family transcriptional activator
MISAAIQLSRNVSRPVEHARQQPREELCQDAAALEANVLAPPAILAKTMPPDADGTLHRDRLHQLLDRCLNKQITWIAARAGAGKTRLLAGYLVTQKTPALWYNCDEGDSDPATFFYYLRLAAGKLSLELSASLPLLNAEYLFGASVFAHRYFEKLSSLLQHSGAREQIHDAPFGLLILDNYQEIAARSELHAMLAHGLEELGPGIRVVVLSREEPPEPLARLRAYGRMALVEYEDLRFTAEESIALMEARHAGMDREAMRCLHDLAQGWAPGLLLMHERRQMPHDPEGGADDMHLSGIFDYFAEEIFNRREVEVQQFMLVTSLLPTVNAARADSLLQINSSARILARLCRQQLFVEPLPTQNPEYRYHPLLRRFLSSRAAMVYTREELNAYRCRAGILLEQCCQIEDAARLFQDAGDHALLAGLVRNYAASLLAQGRNKTIMGWLNAIPEELRNDSWLTYWRGMAAFPSDLNLARQCLRTALQSFRALREWAGVYLSWAGLVDTCSIDLNAWKPLDDLIQLFDELQQENASFSGVETELLVYSRLLTALTLRKTDCPEQVHQCQEHLQALLHSAPSTEIECDVLFTSCLYALWKGEHGKSSILLKNARPQLPHHELSPFRRIRLKLIAGVHAWVAAEYDEAEQLFFEALQISGDSGVQIFDALLWSFIVAANLARGAKEKAQEYLARQQECALRQQRLLDLYFYHVNMAWRALLCMNPEEALEYLQFALEQAERVGNPYYRALACLGMAQAFELQKAHDKSAEQLQNARLMNHSMQSYLVEWYINLIEAWRNLQLGAEAEALLGLYRALTLARKYGFVHLEFYLPDVMRTLLARALMENIEKEYVLTLIGKLKLTPPEHDESNAWMALGLEEWPYPVRIYTLGKFEIRLHGEPLTCCGKDQKKPLDMLRVLIALGGSEVSEEQISDLLWPDSEGDLAHKSFQMTLSRLRRLLADSNCLLYRGHHLTLDDKACWVDSIALQSFPAVSEDTSDAEDSGLRSRALRLFQGPFLPGKASFECFDARRHLLNKQHLRLLRGEGRRAEGNGLWQTAAEFYQRALGIDDLSEHFYRRLICCQRKMGENSDAARTYMRCVTRLQQALGISPSSETTSLYAAMTRPVGS